MHTHNHIEPSSVAIFIRKRQHHPVIYRVLCNLNTNPSSISEHTFYCSFPLLPLSGQHIGSSSGLCTYWSLPVTCYSPPRSAELLPSNPSRPDSGSFSVRPTLSTLLKTAAPGNSFAVQWLGLHTSALGDTSVILGRGTKIF